ncbi:MAG TPA: GNAT family N-acetyltransferase [Kofleriaceae bacterium]|nr:GNAT family N-acetyltransferase [Kofleriaceae bacterium]
MRPARDEDRELFFVTRRDGFRRYVEANKPWDDGEQRASANADFDALPVEIIERGGVAIGYQIVEHNDDHWRLDEIALVAPERNRGIGTDLVRAIMASARAAGMPLRLNCLRANPARRLYDRLGFRVIAEEDVRVRMEWP